MPEQAGEDAITNRAGVITSGGVDAGANGGEFPLIHHKKDETPQQTKVHHRVSSYHTEIQDAILLKACLPHHTASPDIRNN